MWIFVKSRNPARGAGGGGSLLKLRGIEPYTPKEHNFPHIRAFFVSPYASMASPKKHQTVQKLMSFRCYAVFYAYFCQDKVKIAIPAEICIKKPYIVRFPSAYPHARRACGCRGDARLHKVRADKNRNAEQIRAPVSLYRTKHTRRLSS